MITLNMKQGSEEWKDARLGVATASQFHRIVTPKTMKLSGQADGYAHELLAEEMLGHALDDAESQFMVRGSDLEDGAISFYEFNRDLNTSSVGFLLREDGLVGCSPDRLVGDDGGLEIKCPKPKTHVAHMLGGGDAEHAKCQVQGALWLTGRAWWDWLSYNPEMQPVLIRFERDEQFIAVLEKLVNQFVEYVDECRRRLIRDGYYPDDALTIRANRRRELGVKE